jgi:hypothetical protein
MLTFIKNSYESFRFDTAQLKMDLGQETAKGSPPILVLTAQWLFDLKLDDWVKIATLGYIALQAAWLLWKWYYAAKKKK